MGASGPGEDLLPKACTMGALEIQPTCFGYVISQVREGFVLRTWVLGRTGIMDVDPCSCTGPSIRKGWFIVLWLPS